MKGEKAVEAVTTTKAKALANQGKRVNNDLSDE